jgi:ribosomal protein S18 acetylase RimI-like enzyme
MDLNKLDDYKVTNTTENDLETVYWLFEQAMSLQGKNDYRVWKTIDKIALKKDIENRLQFKIVKDNEIICIFSVQYDDPFIWRDRDKNDAIYLHRIVVNPNFKGQKQFEKVLNWTKRFARQNHLKYIRMDTWADNAKIIGYYKSFGFVFIENYKTTDIPELPIQNRNLNMALLELKLMEE